MVARRGERIEVAPDACRRVRSRHHHAGPVRSWDTQNPPGRDGIGSRSVALACVAALLAAQRPPGVSCGLPAMALAHSGERVLPSRSGFLNGLLGREFVAEVDAALSRVAESPLQYQVLHRETRRAIVH